MGIHLYAVYRVKEEEITTFFGSKNVELADKIYQIYHRRFADLDHSLSMYEGQNIRAKYFLNDICDGAINYPNQVSIYSYVFEMLCDYFGIQCQYLSSVADTMLYNSIHGYSGYTFIPIPFNRDFPSIVCIRHQDIELEKQKFRDVSNVNGIDNEELMFRKENFIEFFKEAQINNMGVAFFVSD